MKKNKQISHFDPNRETVGKIYRDLHLNNPSNIIEVGDMSNSMLPGLVEDINEAIKAGSKEFEGRDFYILIHEKKDLQMRDALLRKVIKLLYRPYPEDDTTVFWHSPKLCETRFCWSLPHWSEMDNMLNSYKLYDENLIREIRSWKALDLYSFGFIKDDMGNWIANPNWKDKALENRKAA